MSEIGTKNVGILPFSSTHYAIPFKWEGMDGCWTQEKLFLHLSHCVWLLPGRTALSICLRAAVLQLSLLSLCIYMAIIQIHLPSKWYTSFIGSRPYCKWSRKPCMNCGWSHTTSFQSIFTPLPLPLPDFMSELAMLGQIAMATRSVHKNNASPGSCYCDYLFFLPSLFLSFL